MLDQSGLRALAFVGALIMALPTIWCATTAAQALARGERQDADVLVLGALCGVLFFALVSALCALMAQSAG